MEENKTKKPSEFAELRKIWAFSKRESGTYRISGYKGEEVEDIVIPATINGVKVTELGNGEGQIFSRLIATKIKRLIIPEGIEKINGGAFQSCESLEHLSLPEGLKSIVNGAFYKCKSLKTVMIPTSVKEIGWSVFSVCESLEQVILSENLEKIGYETFYNCKSLKTITIPQSVKEIGKGAFSGCCSLKIVFEGSVPKIDWDALKDVKVIYAPKATAKDFAQNKEAYLIGFLQLLKEGKADSELIKINNQNIKQNALKLCETKNEELFTYILQNKLITIKTTDELIAKYNEEKNIARVSALIDYKDKNFTEGQKERQFNKQFEIKEPKGQKEPSEFAELRKIWTFSKRESGTYRISGYKGEEVEDIVIPATINGVKVTELGNGEGQIFSRLIATKIKRITIPESIEKINSVAFQICESLEQLSLPEGLETIAYCTFRYCKSLKSIDIPGSVREIGVAAFGSCQSLEQVTLSEGLERIGYGAFQDCKSLKTITIPGSVREIVENAFMGCQSLKRIVFDGAVPKLGRNALGDVEAIYAPKATAKDFAQNKEAYLIGFLQMLKEGKADSELIKINNQNIKQNALKLCETKNEELFTYILQNKLITLKTTDELIAKYNEERNVARVSALIDYKDKNFTEGQKERQFNKQFEIKEPKAPTELAKLKEIWNFTKTEEGTYRITAYKGEDVNVTVPTEIKGISVTEIGSNTFHYQERIKNVTLPDGIKLIRNGTFDGCEALKTITIPASVKEIGNYAFCNCESLEQIILPEGLTNIGYWAFNNCKSLKTITIPSSVKEIGNYAFCNCESLEEINLPEGLMNIGYGAFQDCKSLKTITIPSSVKELLINNNNFGCSDPDSGVFNGCGSLKEVVLSKELEKIEYGTFKDCKALKSIIIPASVKEIGGYVFLDCPDITIYCRIDEQPKDWVWGWNAIDDDGHKAKVVWGYKGE